MHARSYLRSRAGPPRRLMAGLTLVEMAVAVSLAVILLAMAVPPFAQLLARMRLEGAGSNLSTDLQLARTEALQRRASVALATTADGTGYTLSVGGTTIKTMRFPTGVTFTASTTTTFEPLRGLANAASFTGAATPAVGQLRVSSDAMGRVQLCTPDGLLKGYPSC